MSFKFSPFLENLILSHPSTKPESQQEASTNLLVLGVVAQPVAEEVDLPLGVVAQPRLSLSAPGGGLVQLVAVQSHHVTGGRHLGRDCETRKRKLYLSALELLNQ